MQGFSIVILGAQRIGVVNPLAEAHGVSHKCLVPICGKPLLTHVLDTVTAMNDVSAIHVSIEADAHSMIEPLLAPYRSTCDTSLRLVASSPGIADSAINALDGLEPPFIITTADNVLVTPEAIRALADALKTADVAAGLASEASIKAVHPDAQRRFYDFADGGFSNCNLYGIAGRHALSAAEIFREGGQFMKNPRRLVTAFGLLNIVMMKWKWLSLSSAFRRMSKRFGLTIAEVVYPQGELAVDVDNERTYAIAEPILAKRLGLRS
jgi:GTP:adenosylcobinamide-phosphate guanylyltransferase